MSTKRIVAALARAIGAGPCDVCGRKVDPAPDAAKHAQGFWRRDVVVEFGVKRPGAEHWLHYGCQAS